MLRLVKARRAARPGRRRFRRLDCSSLRQLSGKVISGIVAELAVRQSPWPQGSQQPRPVFRVIASASQRAPVIIPCGTIRCLVGTVSSCHSSQSVCSACSPLYEAWVACIYSYAATFSLGDTCVFICASDSTDAAAGLKLGAAAFGLCLAAGAL